MTYIHALAQWASTEPADFSLRVSAGALVVVILVAAVRHGLFGHR